MTSTLSVGTAVRGTGAILSFSVLSEMVDSLRATAPPFQTLEKVGTLKGFCFRVTCFIKLPHGDSSLAAPWGLEKNYADAY